ncbi:MAG: hypothetical protein IJW24_00620 [Clostridia bacterium]|nr:hypothetical protein [Clostridia bacterium]
MQQKNIQALRAEHERREVEYARSMQRVFPPELFDAVKSNIDKLEKLGVQGEFKRDFEIKVSDLEWVMGDFLTRAVINEDYAGKLGSVLNGTNPNLDIERITSIKHPEFSKAGLDENLATRTNPNGKEELIKLSKSRVVFPLAKRKQKDVLTTNFECLAISIHESGHAVAERNISGKPLQMKCEEIGEIESMVIERLFMFHMCMSQTNMNSHFMNKWHQPFADGAVGDGILKKAYLDHLLESNKGLLHRLEKITDANHCSVFGSDHEASKQYAARYVFGEIVSTLFLTEYVLNPSEAMENLNNFVKHNHEITKFGDVAEMLLPQTLEKLRAKPENQGKGWHELVIKRYIDLSSVLADEKIVDDYDEKF